MRPRVAFAIVLAVGAVLHVGLLGGTAASSRSMAVYFGWLALAAVTAAIYVGRSFRDDREARRNLRPGRRPPARSRVEGLGLLIIPAAAGMFIHLMTVFTNTSTRDFRRGMWLCLFILGTCAYIALRKKYSDEEPPIQDDSPVARAFVAVQYAFGGVLLLIGSGMLYRVMSFSGGNDSLNQAASLLMLAGGIALITIGALVIALRLRKSG
jgi:hypothetical protein